ncbi:MAG: sensor histidine kinase [Alphaproteobacteria bacterium]|nr:sensor histidine kinase [Alphaproteobacteria bacterium]MBV8408731.1 sensor histidine kinase [Alphaproteobacteria bacterium]
MPGSSSFQAEVAGRFGVLPNFFCTAQSAPGLIEELWGFARAAYLDCPLPSLFKERLFVHLSRFCAVRYCIVRHVGFLIGNGWPAGDAAAPVESIDNVIALLSRPLPDADELKAVLERLSRRDRSLPFPGPRTQTEADLFDALTVIFLEPAKSGPARETVRTSTGDRTFEILVAYLAFIRAAHYWTETHPELEYEPDMLGLMDERRDLRAVLLDPADAESVSYRQEMRKVLDELQRTQVALRTSEERLRILVGELQHRTRNLLGVVGSLVDSSLSSNSNPTAFRVAFRERLNALSRAQDLLSRLSEGERVAFDDLIRTELAALGAADGNTLVTVKGPTKVKLRSRMVQTLALAIHELGTNALKYGALKQSGTLAVTWRVDRSEEPPRLHVEWRESGISVPSPDSAAFHMGNGRKLIERALPYQLGARTSLKFRPDSVCCTISIPLEGATAEEVEEKRE